MRRELGFSLIELMIIVAITGVLASVALPSYAKYLKRSRTVEATMNLRRMYDGAVAYYLIDHVDAQGHNLGRDFPGTAGPTPATPPAGVVMPASASLWDVPEWQALNFGVNDPFRFSYTFSHNSTTSADVIAQGDLDGDTVPSLFSRAITGTNDGVSGGAGLYVVNELE
jgi:type II secretory pathway pseudopilin PulG